MISYQSLLLSTTVLNDIYLLYCILRGRIKGFNSFITAIMCQVGSYRTSYRTLE